MAPLFETSSSAAKSNLASLFASKSIAVKQGAQSRRQASASKLPNESSNGLADSSQPKASVSSEVSDSSIASDEEGSNQDREHGRSKPVPRKHTTEAKDSATTSQAKKLSDVNESSPARTESRRKRKRDDDDIEGNYMKRLARDEEREEKQKTNEGMKNVYQTLGGSTSKEQMPTNGDATDGKGGPNGVSNVDADESSDDAIPQHETLIQPEDTDLEKASRTVFLGNVASSAITSKSDKNALTAHLTSFIPNLPASKPPHKIESFRFRSTAYATTVPKKAAFARQELMDATTKSTNAYVVYSTKQAAREAASRLNGTVILDRHLRVDVVAHPAKIDHHRCVFVGNLSFVDDESQMKASEAAEREVKKPSKTRHGDVEEGLWRQFGKAGTVESVRVVRDQKTRVSKGIAYVQFTDENAVESALLFNDKMYPPLLPRKLRVGRAKKFKKTQTAAPSRSNSASRAKRPDKGQDSEQQSLQGRVKKLLGRAGAAQMSDGRPQSRLNGQSFKRPESFVFEGHRASSKQGGGGVKSKKSKKAGKPTHRGAKRGAAWKTKSGTGKK